MRITRVKQSAGRPTAVGGRNSRGQPWTAIMAVDGRDGCGRPRTTVAAVDGNEQLLTAVDGSDGCGRMPTAVDRRGRLSMAMMLADSPGQRWRDAQGRGQVQEWRRSGHGRVLHTSSVWCYHQHATHEILNGIAAAMPGFAWAAPAVLGSGDRSNMPPCPPRGRPLSRPRRGLTCECAIMERLDSIGNSCIF